MKKLLCWLGWHKWVETRKYTVIRWVKCSRCDKRRLEYFSHVANSWEAF